MNFCHLRYLVSRTGGVFLTSSVFFLHYCSPILVRNYKSSELKQILRPRKRLYFYLSREKIKGVIQATWQIEQAAIFSRLRPVHPCSPTRTEDRLPEARCGARAYIKSQKISLLLNDFTKYLILRT